MNGWDLSSVWYIYRSVIWFWMSRIFGNLAFSYLLFTLILILFWSSTSYGADLWMNCSYLVGDFVTGFYILIWLVSFYYFYWSIFGCLIPLWERASVKCIDIRDLIGVGIPPAKAVLIRDVAVTLSIGITRNVKSFMSFIFASSHPLSSCSILVLSFLTQVMFLSNLQL